MFKTETVMFCICKDVVMYSCPSAKNSNEVNNFFKTNWNLDTKVTDGGPHPQIATHLLLGNHTPIKQSQSAD